MNIKNKIVINTVSISLALIIFSIISLMWQSNKLGKDLLFSIQKDRLTSIRYFKTLEIQTYFNNLIENTSILASNREIVNGLQNFRKNFAKYILEVTNLRTGYNPTVIDNYLQDFNNKYKYYNNNKDINPKILLNSLSENSLALQYNYIFNNPYHLYNKELMQGINDGTNYSLNHAKYHPIFLAYKQQFGFYDMFLVDNLGNIVYSVNKEVDFATSLTTGQYAQTDLGGIFKTLMDPGHKNDFVAISDFAPYLAYYNNQAAFIGVPVYNEIGEKIGGMITQISIEKINEIISNQQEWANIGLGSSINTSIIGADYKLRTNNRFFLENPDNFLTELQNAGIDQETINTIKFKNSLVGILKTDTVAVREAFSGKEGFAEYIDYRKIPVISSFAPLKIPGLNWAIVVKMNKQEALSWMQTLKQNIITNGLVIAIIFGIISMILGSITAKSIAKYINNITAQINNITQTKDLTKRLIGVANSEFSVMINAFNNFVGSLQTYLGNIIKITQKGKLDLGELIPVSDHQESIDQHSILTKELCNQIEALSKEFKIIEEIQEKTKYW